MQKPGFILVELVHAKARRTRQIIEKGESPLSHMITSCDLLSSGSGGSIFSVFIPFAKVSFIGDFGLLVVEY